MNDLIGKYYLVCYWDADLPMGDVPNKALRKHYKSKTWALKKANDLLLKDYCSGVRVLEMPIFKSYDPIFHGLSYRENIFEQKKEG